MKIEYLPNLPSAGGKIDLSAFKKKEKPTRPEDFLPALTKSLRSQAEEINSEFPGLLTDSAQIEMVGPEAEKDSSLVAQQEFGFASSSGKQEERWREDRDKNPSNLTEIALTLLFHKFLKNDFIVARASAYDDYNNGVDLVLIDKKTGAIVCGFDEVITHFKDGNSPKKEEKLKRKMQAGGARLKYGAFIKEGRLERGSRHNLPAFYLALTRNELDDLLPVLAQQAEGNNGQKKESQQGPEVPESLEKLFVSLATSLDNQLRVFAANRNLHPHLLDNLNKFQSSLLKIKTASQSEKQEEIDVLAANAA